MKEGPPLVDTATIWEADRCQLLVGVLQSVDKLREIREHYSVMEPGKPVILDWPSISAPEEHMEMRVTEDLIFGMQKIAFSLYMDLVDSGNEATAQDVVSYFKPIDNTQAQE